jgi:hypothetical protein
MVKLAAESISSQGIWMKFSNCFDCTSESTNYELDYQVWVQARNIQPVLLQNSGGYHMESTMNQFENDAKLSCLPMSSPNTICKALRL